MKRLLTVILCLTIIMSMSAVDKLRVACIGNSITYGFKLPDRQDNAYPSQLQRLLGPDYVVGNFGHSGATLLRKGHNPYFETPEFKQALDFSPDIAVIHLGVNDTDPRNWPLHNADFVGDYLALIDSLRAVNPEVRVIVARLTPIRAGHPRFATGTRDWRLKIQKAIDVVAAKAGAELIDFDVPLRDRQELITDNVHPNVEGASILAETVRGAITGDYGGLSLPEVMQSGMVLQRNRPLKIRGRADAGSRIELTLDDRRYHAVADNCGDWSITTAPLVTGPVYTMTVTDGKTTLTLTDILAGEVWLASGQSNMEFRLWPSLGGREATASSSDSLFRIFHMKEIARTNSTEWADSLIDSINVLKHYRPTKWEAVSPANVGRFSAVAYHFGRRLRDSLDVPVGIIANPVGGSPAEAWIDINTLEERMPGILLNPIKNDYLQKWVQSRIVKNLGERAGVARHPYLPSYLFAAGIRPLNGYPVAGVIWYQGESNVHNADLFEQLFPMVVDSWRREFSQPDMPFYYVQLSSLGQPGWAEFRDCQRRLSEKIPHTAMAVSHDLGDSLDVHPLNKRPVGERLARIALKRSYGFNQIVDQGPVLREAVSLPGRMVLSFDNADGLTSSDGNKFVSFEIAEIDGLYFPAEATISPDDNTITLTNMNVKTPRYVRYGWQSFTRANLVNSQGLPASTFKAEASNIAELDMEPGYEYGVSAVFSGRLGDRLIIAGGANFPYDDPLGPAVKKKLYRGIYAADAYPADGVLAWRRIGSLPEPMAYGASATTSDGPVFIGTDRSVRLLMTDGSLSDLPAMPVDVDNAAAAAIGSVVYVCGGNVDGKPSSALYALDLNTPSNGWTKLRPMPGHPRVQPVMVASGEELYVWGGFAGRHHGKAPTLETSGLKYSPATGKWTPLPAPVDDDGNEVSLGGGAAVTLPDGRIAAFGGVNKDVFLDALREQADDYLYHPIDWYRFNSNVLVYDPSTGKWRVADFTPDTARAGAAAVGGPQGEVFLYGGELKPRVRTSETTVIRF